MSPPAFFTVAQAAPLLGIGTDALYELCRMGLIAHRRIGPRRGRILLTEQDIRAYLEASRIVPGASAEQGAPERTPPARKAVTRRPGASGRPDGRPIRHF